MSACAAGRSGTTVQVRKSGQWGGSMRGFGWAGRARERQHALREFCVLRPPPRPSSRHRPPDAMLVTRGNGGSPFVAAARSRSRAPARCSSCQPPAEAHDARMQQQQQQSGRRVVLGGLAAAAVAAAESPGAGALTLEESTPPVAPPVPLTPRSVARARGVGAPLGLPCCCLPATSSPTLCRAQRAGCRERVRERRAGRGQHF